MRDRQLIIAVARGISKRRRGEDQLPESFHKKGTVEEHLSRIFEYSNDAIPVIDSKPGKILKINGLMSQRM